MPSSVMFGSRPRIFWTRAYSSEVRPCSAAISAVTLISVLAVAIIPLKSWGRSIAAPLQQKNSLRPRSESSNSCGGLSGADQRFDHTAENDQAVGGAEGRFDGAFRMRHKAGDVSFAIADTGDVVHGPIWISCHIIFAVCAG